MTTFKAFFSCVVGISVAYSLLSLSVSYGALCTGDASTICTLPPRQGGDTAECRRGNGSYMLATNCTTIADAVPTNDGCGRYWIIATNTPLIVNGNYVACGTQLIGPCETTPCAGS